MRLNEFTERVLLYQVDSGDTFLFYFSGHGFQAENKQYVLPFDAQTWAITKGGGNAVAIDFIETATRIDGVERILIVDACRKPLEKGKDFQDEVDGVSSKAICGVVQHVPPTSPVSILYSCSPGQRSYEFEKLGGGVFTTALLQVFSQFAKNKLEISLQKIVDQVQGKVSEFLSEYSSQPLAQQPFIVGGKVVILHGVNPVASKENKLEPQQQTAITKGARDLSSVTGLWRGHYGLINLTQTADRVHGEFQWKGEPWIGIIEGKNINGTIVARWMQGSIEGLVCWQEKTHNSMLGAWWMYYSKKKYLQMLQKPPDLVSIEIAEDRRWNIHRAMP